MIGADILKTLLKEGEEPFSKALRDRLTTMSRNPNTIGALDDIADKMNIYKKDALNLFIDQNKLDNHPINNFSLEYFLIKTSARISINYRTLLF